MKGLRPSGMLCCVTELVISDFFKEHIAFVVKVQKVESMDPLTLESEVIMFL
jgi:tRNA-binding EMAP/Myf-like protein